MPEQKGIWDERSLTEVYRASDAVFHARRVAFAEQHRTAVERVTVCGCSPMRVQLLAAPLAKAVIDNGLAGLLVYCRREQLRVEIERVGDSAELVRTVVHWRCCYDRVPR